MQFLLYLREGGFFEYEPFEKGVIMIMGIEEFTAKFSFDPRRHGALSLAETVFLADKTTGNIVPKALFALMRLARLANVPQIGWEEDNGEISKRGEALIKKITTATGVSPALLTSQITLAGSPQRVVAGVVENQRQIRQRLAEQIKISAVLDFTTVPLSGAESAEVFPNQSNQDLVKKYGLSMRMDRGLFGTTAVRLWVGSPEQAVVAHQAIIKHLRQAKIQEEISEFWDQERANRNRAFYGKDIILTPGLSSWADFYQKMFFRSLGEFPENCRWVFAIIPEGAIEVRLFGLLEEAAALTKLLRIFEPFRKVVEGIK